MVVSVRQPTPSRGWLTQYPGLVDALKKLGIFIPNMKEK